MQPRPTDDANSAELHEMIDRARQRDEFAFQQLTNGLREELRELAARKTASRRLRGQWSADDLVQETLMEAWKGIESFAGATQYEFRSWIVVILHHTINKTFRSAYAQKRNPFPNEVLPPNGDSSSTPPIEPAAREVSPSRSVRQKETYERVWVALNTLEEPYRTIFRRRLIEETSLQQIAKETGLTPGAVQGKLRTALKHFRDAFGGEFSSI